MFVSRKNFIDWLAEKDFIKFSSILGDWNSWHNEACIAKEQNPKYWGSLVPGEQTAWDSFGQKYIEQLEKNKRQGYNQHNTRAWSTHTLKTDIVLSFQEQITKSLPLMFATSRVGCQPPGNILPWHQDTFAYYSRQHPQDIKWVVRFVVFMQDWQMGHVLQAGSSVITHWKAGDVMVWHPERWHVSANIGNTDKWTMNITGALNEEFESPIDILD